MLSRRLLPISHPRSPPKLLQRVLLPIGGAGTAKPVTASAPPIGRNPKPGPSPKPLKHVSRRELVSFLVSSAHAIGHSESDVSEAEDVADAKEAAHACFRMFLDKGLEKSSAAGDGNISDSTTKETQIIERILQEVITTLKRRSGVFANSHALAAALHNLGCFYAADSSQVKAMAMCSRALNMRRALFEDGDRVSISDTPRDKEMDERALGESLNDMGVLNIMRASRESNLERRDKSLETGENYVRDAKTIFDRIHHFLHPVCIITLRNLAWVRHARGYRSEAANLCREALSRSRLALSTSRSRRSARVPIRSLADSGHSDPACLVIDSCLCLVSMCFRHQHLTNETRKCLREALRVNQEAFPESHHFESMRILHKLSQLYFSRRSYKKARQWNAAARKMSFKVKPCLEARMEILEIDQDAQAIRDRIQRIEAAKSKAREEAQRREKEEEARLLLLSGGESSHILKASARDSRSNRPKSAVVGRSHRKKKRSGVAENKSRRRPKSALSTSGRHKNGTLRPKSSHHQGSRIRSRNSSGRTNGRRRGQHRGPAVSVHSRGPGNVGLKRTKAATTIPKSSSPLKKTAWFQGKEDMQRMSWMARDEEARNQRRIEERKAKEVHWVQARHQERLEEMQRVMEQQGEDYQYNREAAMLRRSVYLSPRDPPVKLMHGVPCHLRVGVNASGRGDAEGGMEAKEALSSSPKRNMSGLPARRAKSASLHRRTSSERSSANFHSDGQSRYLSQTLPHSRSRRKRPVSSSPSASHSRSMMWVPAPRTIVNDDDAATLAESNNETARGDGLFPAASISSKQGDLANHILHSDM